VNWKPGPASQGALAVLAALLAFVVLWPPVIWFVFYVLGPPMYWWWNWWRI